MRRCVGREIDVRSTGAVKSASAERLQSGQPSLRVGKNCWQLSLLTLTTSALDRRLEESTGVRDKKALAGFSICPMCRWECIKPFERQAPIRPNYQVVCLSNHKRGSFANVSMKPECLSKKMGYLRSISFVRVRHKVSNLTTFPEHDRPDT